uniref:Uncharacterized protein n=1 Tax=Arundo donax TaxID=35708 RepID=A0A0A9FXL7_ARUDO
MGRASGGMILHVAVSILLQLLLMDPSSPGVLMSLDSWEMGQRIAQRSPRRSRHWRLSL